jgi:8-oxo-dGTP pyrophosphatase MutT (NUDIX family)
MSDDDRPPWIREVAAALPRIKAHQLINHRPPAGAARRAASVLILFGEGERGPQLLLLQRAAELRSHPGQVAFPGGSQDESDADAVATALREAEEETGLEAAGVDVVGVLPPVWLAVTDFMVTPVIGWWREPSRVHAADPAETASVHVVAVDDLLDPAHRGQVRHPSGYVGPAFRVDDILVWGFTAQLLGSLFALLGWERDWDREQYFELTPAILAGSRRDVADRRTASTPSAAAAGRADRT